MSALQTHVKMVLHVKTESVLLVLCAPVLLEKNMITKTDVAKVKYLWLNVACG